MFDNKERLVNLLCFMTGIHAGYEVQVTIFAPTSGENTARYSARNTAPRC